MSLAVGTSVLIPARKIKRNVHLSKSRCLTAWKDSYKFETARIYSVTAVKTLSVRLGAAALELYNSQTAIVSSIPTTVHSPLSVHIFPSISFSTMSLTFFPIFLITVHVSAPYTGCPRRNVPNFGRLFLMLNYTDITQNTYIQSWTVTEIMAREVWNFDSCYSLIDYQIHIETGRNMWFL